MGSTKITLVPHTHWDREWYVPFGDFSKRLVEMMDTLLDLADRGFPHFHLDGQTAMIDDYLAERPERAADVARHVAAGRLSAGPWFTQMDEFLTSGESHIRNLERGLGRARELGRALEVGYMPDQFGHIGQMPQILMAGGLDRAVVWRGVPRSVDKDAFWWEAPDGSRVLTEYMAFGYFNGEAYNEISQPEELAAAMKRTIERQRAFMASDRMLVMAGYDHSGPDPTFRERLEAARPYLGSIDAEIADIERHVEGKKTIDLPLWRGELRSSSRANLLPNVYSARVHQKRERGRLESLIERYAEPLAALVPGFEWPAAELDRVWQLLLWNGAHDSACGCSHDQVGLDVDARFAEARMLCEGVVRDALASLGTKVADAGQLQWNPSPFDRDGVPGLGWRVDASEVAPVEVPVAVHDGGDGEFLADGFRLLLLDEPDVGDLYNYCYAEEGQVPWAPAENRISGQTVTAWFDQKLEVEVRVSRHEGEVFLRLDGVIRNARPDHRLRLHVALARDVDGALAGSPFELVQRPLVGEGGEIESASPTWPARHVVMAGETAVLHEGVFEYEVAGGRELAITLLRCVGTISRDQMATRAYAAGPDVSTPNAQMLGETAFSLGVWWDATADGLLDNWERFALPPVSAPATGGGSLPRAGSLLEIEGDGELSNVRRKDGRVEARLWNPRKDLAVEATVGGRFVTLGPAKIGTILLN